MSDKEALRRHKRLVRTGLSQLTVEGLTRILDYCKDNDLLLTGAIFDIETGDL